MFWKDVYVADTNFSHQRPQVLLAGVPLKVFVKPIFKQAVFQVTNYPLRPVNAGP